MGVCSSSWLPLFADGSIALIGRWGRGVRSWGSAPLLLRGLEQGLGGWTTALQLVRLRTGKASVRPDKV